jgi:uncharacterized membrane protein YfcA
VSLVLPLVAFVAAAVNGGLGYGFSSITVPVALLFQANRVLNPALVLIELFVNGLALIANRRSLRRVLPKMPFLLVGLAPGVVAGSLLLTHVDSGLLKVCTFSVLLPLILLQSAGLRRPIRHERLAAVPAGALFGALYGATTISGPPLALLFNNQGLQKDDFRAALSVFRVMESLCTLTAYLALGLFDAPVLALAGSLAPSVVIGLPLGYIALRKVAPEPFRRVCMAADALLVGFALARTLVAHHFVPAPFAWAGLSVVAAVEAAILLSFALRRSIPEEPALPATGGARTRVALEAVR